MCGREKRSDSPFGKTGISPRNPRGIVGKLGATRKFIILVGGGGGGIERVLTFCASALTMDGSWIQA
jgi:hypothetical protein